jgi:alpha-galactosidase
MLTLAALLVPLLGAIPATDAFDSPTGVGKLPALGWNSWNAYGCNISEDKFLTAAQKLVDLGLKVRPQIMNLGNCNGALTNML